MSEKLKKRRKIGKRLNSLQCGSPLLPMSPVGLLYATGALVKGVSGNVACVVGVTLGAGSEGEALGGETEGETLGAQDGVDDGRVVGKTLGAEDGAIEGTLVGAGVMAAISSTLISTKALVKESTRAAILLRRRLLMFQAAPRVSAIRGR